MATATTGIVSAEFSVAGITGAVGAEVFRMGEFGTPSRFDGHFPGQYDTRIGVLIGGGSTTPGALDPVAGLYAHQSTGHL